MRAMLFARVPFESSKVTKTESRLTVRRNRISDSGALCFSQATGESRRAREPLARASANARTWMCGPHAQPQGRLLAGFLLLSRAEGESTP